MITLCSNLLLAALRALAYQYSSAVSSLAEVLWCSTSASKKIIPMCFLLSNNHRETATKLTLVLEAQKPECDKIAILESLVPQIDVEVLSSNTIIG